MYLDFYTTKKLLKSDIQTHFETAFNQNIYNKIFANFLNTLIKK